jgi:hypothetical protein
MNQQFIDVLTNLENRRGVKQGIHDYNGFSISVEHFQGTTGKYTILQTGKAYKSYASAKNAIDSGKLFK